MIDRFTEFIKKHALFDYTDKILIAFSGGVDSMVMADLFKKTGYNFALAHCNFLLRGADSDKDEEFARTTAKKYGVPIFVRIFNTAEYARERKISIEMAARDIRYSYFEETMADHGYNLVATAHHLGDSLETIILNLARGTGISGLRGIVPKRQSIVRPMLFADKAMLIDYAKKNQLEWREDQSNKLDIYQRNLIRLKVIPQLMKINPGLFEATLKTTSRLRFAERVFQSHMEKIKGEIMEQRGQDFFLSKTKLMGLEEPEAVLSEILKEYGFNSDQCDNIFNRLESTGAIFMSSRYLLNVDREFLLISPKPPEEKFAELIFHKDTMELNDEHYSYSCRVYERKGKDIRRENHVAQLDFDRLEFPLRLRKWKHGDRFVPLGMKHKKKLSDFMIDEKIPVNLKQSVKVLVSGNEIVWLVGYRIDERYKLTSDTKMVYEMTVAKK